ncbi:hypothetical protein KKF91_12820 [Myxococcota bacterium]|nr:hypothetical protein [Myxococcota bacterium]MBU1431417.1 hypothetical protein [Myxococcota bacterium]MBU1897817.1 hypothetical protein [Myxococcota bacterium]
MILLWISLALLGCLDPSKYEKDPEAGAPDIGGNVTLDAARFDLGAWPPVDAALPPQDMPLVADMGGDLALSDAAPVEEDAAPIEEDATPPPTSCQVEFIVQVPEGTDAIYVAGDMTSWEPNTERLALSGQEARSTLSLPLGPTNYKYTRGGWETVEKAGDCGEQDNRALTVRCGPDGIAPPVIDSVARWADGC